MAINEQITVEKDELTGDTLLSGHESDITIIWSVVYIFMFDVIKVAPYQVEEWKKEMAAVGALSPGQPAPVESASLVALTDKASLDAGKEIWLKQCKVCHLDGGQGLVGPNLTDNFSIHGCTYADVVTIITNGAPEKGMISWKTQLSDDQIKKVASFVMTLKGTTPPNPKAPQGDPCK